MMDAKKAESGATKRVADSCAETIHILRYAYLNDQRRLFGGVLMQWIDEVAGIAAYRHSGCNVITAVIDQLLFKEPAFLGEMIVLRGRVTYVGRTSMEVRVDVQVEKADGKPRSINRAYLVMVAVDENGQPVPVPRLELVSDEERHEWAMAEKRNELRKTRRAEKF